MKVTKEQFIGVTYDELLAENEELLAFNDELLVLMRLKDMAVMGELLGENERLQEDNAKLRELVRDMWEGYNDPRCEECHLKDTPTCADCPICAREASVIDRMRELGVDE